MTVSWNWPSASVTVAGASKVPPPWVCVFPLMTTVTVAPGATPVWATVVVKSSPIVRVAALPE